MPKCTKDVEQILDVNYPEATNWQFSAVARAILRMKIFLETDALYLIPSGMDAQWNRPELVCEVAKPVAYTSMQITIEDVA